MYAPYAREKEDIDRDKTRQWIARGDLKGCTVALICSAQNKLYEILYWSYSKIPFVQNVWKEGRNGGPCNVTSE